LDLSAIPEPIRCVVAEIVSRGFPVWVIGSQINPTSKPPVDWDFMVFGDGELLVSLATRDPVPDAGLLIVTDGNNFASPWADPRTGNINRGSLQSWKWQELDSEHAIYEGTKWPDDWGSIKKARRIRGNCIDAA
jgi:hypothetical protein